MELSPYKQKVDGRLTTRLSATFLRHQKQWTVSQKVVFCHEELTSALQQVY